MSYVSNHRFITVPKNQDGLVDYESMLDESANFITFRLPNDEYNRLWDNGVFKILEAKYEDVYISDGESSKLTADELKAVYPGINVLPGTFLDAVDKAIEYGTCIFLDF